MRRRFLIYDLMMLNGQNLMREPFRDRYEKIDREILHPRMAEREMCERGMLKYHYDYNLEPFSVRRKGFYPLTESRKVRARVRSSAAYHVITTFFFLFSFVWRSLK